LNENLLALTARWDYFDEKLRWDAPGV